MSVQNVGAPASKKAILVVSFGTSYAETRAKTIDATEAAIGAAYPDYVIRRAFTSKMIIRILKDRDGIFVDTPEEALQRLCDEGFEEVIVQSLHIINGSEYHDTLKVCSRFRPRFSRFAHGTALLNSPEDYKAVARAFAAHSPALEPGEALLLMGHGSVHGSNAAYPALDYTFKQLGYSHIHVGTVEGYPELPEVLELMAPHRYRKVYLMPLMLVCGDHAVNDMASDEADSWKSVIEAQGCQAEPILMGMGEMPEIRQLFTDHLQKTLEACHELS